MSYWCHECIKGFPETPTPPSNCPHCGGDFIEWINSDNHSDPLLSSEEEALSEEYLDEPPNILGNHHYHYNTTPSSFHHHFSWAPQRRVQGESGNMDYTDLARWFLGMGRSAPVGNLADYGIGQSLDDILNMSFEQDHSSGPPPASKKELSRLKKIKISKEQIATNLECTVCTEKYRINEFCHLLPCKHLFHQECIKPWLKLHNTCPVCRFELKTDDEEYEAKKKKITTTPPPPTTYPLTLTTSSEEGDPLITITPTTTPAPVPPPLVSTRTNQNIRGVPRKISSQTPLNNSYNQSHSLPRSNPRNKKKRPHPKKITTKK